MSDLLLWWSISFPLWVMECYPVLSRQLLSHPLLDSGLWMGAFCDWCGPWNQLFPETWKENIGEGDFDRERCVCVCVEELEVDERRVIQRKNRVTITSPLSAVLFFPSIKHREVSTWASLFPRGNRISRSILMSYQSPLPCIEGSWFAIASLI